MDSVQKDHQDLHFKKKQILCDAKNFTVTSASLLTPHPEKLGKLMDFSFQPMADFPAIPLKNGRFLILKSGKETSLPPEFLEFIRHASPDIVEQLTLASRNKRKAEEYVNLHLHKDRIRIYFNVSERLEMKKSKFDVLFRFFAKYAERVYDPKDTTDELNNIFSLYQQVNKKSMDSLIDHQAVYTDLDTKHQTLVRLSKVLGCNLFPTVKDVYIFSDGDKVCYSDKNGKAISDFNMYSGCFCENSFSVSICENIYHFREDDLKILKQIEQQILSDLKRLNVESIVKNWPRLVYQSCLKYGKKSFWENKSINEPKRIHRKKGNYRKEEKENSLDQILKTTIPFVKTNIYEKVLAEYPEKYHKLLPIYLETKEDIGITEAHELKHAINTIFMNPLLDKNDFDTSQYLKYRIHDERTAFFAENLFLFNEYRQTGNDDLLMRSDMLLARYLYSLPQEKRMTADLQKVCSVILMDCENRFLPLYDDEWKDLLKECVDNPLDFPPVSDQKFTALCNQMSQFFLWNPAKRGYENLDLSDILHPQRLSERNQTLLDKALQKERRKLLKREEKER